MNKTFNTAADCKPGMHYMVDIRPKLALIKEYVDRRAYFTINRARQYGKTTTLRALGEYLRQEYYVVSMDFQVQMSQAKFRNETVFSQAFAKAFLRALSQSASVLPPEMEQVTARLKQAALNGKDLELVELFQYLSDICAAADKPVVLMIDEVDSASNNQVFLDFLSQLRGYYIDRDRTPALWSVILAGVYDIKNLKRKYRPDEAHKVNSPWNIAADFLVDMSFSESEIAGMLREYETDWHTGMDVNAMSARIYAYTSGYPFLVSRICKLLDEQIAGRMGPQGKKQAWTREGFQEAVRLLLSEKNTLFESLIHKLLDYPRIKELLYLLLFQGQAVAYNALSSSVELAEMFGFVENRGGNAEVSNRIFEILLYNYFLAEESLNNETYKAALQDKNQFIRNGQLDMELVLEKFVRHFDDVYGDCSEKFIEEDGRRYFLLYLKPIINGTGNYYVETQTRNMERTDVIVDYGGEQFVIEIKIWRGNAYHTRGETQLISYLDHYHLKKGYMLSFNFNQKKETGVKTIMLGDKILIEAVC